VSPATNEAALLIACTRSVSSPCSRCRLSSPRRLLLIGTTRSWVPFSGSPSCTTVTKCEAPLCAECIAAPDLYGIGSDLWELWFRWMATMASLSWKSLVPWTGIAGEITTLSSYCTLMVLLI
jgi:hypothetical protein